jgi:hypothetical protein
LGRPSFMAMDPPPHPRSYFPAHLDQASLRTPWSGLSRPASPPGRNDHVGAPRYAPDGSHRPPRPRHVAPAVRPPSAHVALGRAPSLRPRRAWPCALHAAVLPAGPCRRAACGHVHTRGPGGRSTPARPRSAGIRARAHEAVLKICYKIVNKLPKVNDPIPPRPHPPRPRPLLSSPSARADRKVASSLAADAARSLAADAARGAGGPRDAPGVSPPRPGLHS